MVGLGDWVNFYFLGKFFKILGNFFSGQKNRKLIISGHIFTIGQHWSFKSVHLATNTLYLMLEFFFKNSPPPQKKFTQSPSPPKSFASGEAPLVVTFFAVVKSFGVNTAISDNFVLTVKNSNGSVHTYSMQNSQNCAIYLATQHLVPSIRYHWSFL